MEKKGCILVVDDEADLRDTLEMILVHLDVHILKAGNGKEALKLMEEHVVDAVISDINMPVMNGFEFLRQVRNMGSDVPFVFITAYGEKASVLEALRLGAMDFIEKPFENRTILQVMEKALELGHSLQEVQIELDSLFQLMEAPSAEVEKKKNIRRAILMTKMDGEVYRRQKGQKY